VSAADGAVSASEAKTLYDPLANASSSFCGMGSRLTAPCSWRHAGAALKQGPQLVVTIDHGLRPQSAGEARAAAPARRLGVAHRTPRGRRQARDKFAGGCARRPLLAAAAAKTAKADRVPCGHTRATIAEMADPDEPRQRPHRAVRHGACVPAMVGGGEAIACSSAARYLGVAHCHARAGENRFCPGIPLTRSARHARLRA
jgi:hypothetical protein